MLNEDDFDKAFWRAESNLLQLAKLCGNGLKLFVAYDTCREPKSATEATMKKSRDEKAKLK